MLYLANSWDNKVWNRIINSRWPQHISPFWSGFLYSESSSEVQIHILAFLEHQSFALKVIEVKSEICEVRIIIIITSTAKRFQTKKTSISFYLSLSPSSCTAFQDLHRTGSPCGVRGGNEPLIKLGFQSQQNINIRIDVFFSTKLDNLL